MINYPVKNPVKICILGGGFGGLYTALRLSGFSWLKNNKCQVTLVEPKDNFLFTPLLYEVLTDELKPWEVAPSYQKLLANKSINFCQDSVTNIDLQNSSVSLENHQDLLYDYLVLAVGTTNRFAPIPGFHHCLTFRSEADALLLKERLALLLASNRQRLRIAVVGAGANGVELACKVADILGKRGEVSLLDRGTEILKSFPKGVKKAADKAIKKRGIEVIFETTVLEVCEDSIILGKKDGAKIQQLDLIIWTAGTQPREIISSLQCKQNDWNQLLTLPTLQLVEFPHVFALGDIANIDWDGNIAPAKAQAAYQAADVVGDNLKALLLDKPLKRFRYLHLGDMMTLGVGDAIVSSFFVNIGGSLGALIRRVVYIQRLPTWRHRLQVFKNLLLGFFSGNK